MRNMIEKRVPRQKSNDVLVVPSSGRAHASNATRIRSSITSWKEYLTRVGIMAMALVTIHKIVGLESPSFALKKQRTLVIIEKIPKAGTSSLRNHIFNITGMKTCYKWVNHFFNETTVGVRFGNMTDFPKVSHLCCFLQYMGKWKTIMHLQ